MRFLQVMWSFKTDWACVGVKSLTFKPQPSPKNGSLGEVTL
jgi:hypothetical protein